MKRGKRKSGANREEEVYKVNWKMYFTGAFE